MMGMEMSQTDIKIEMLDILSSNELNSLTQKK